MKRVVITGASGFVGANLARRLLADGHQVHALLREGYDHWRVREIADVMTLHIVDLLDGEALAATTAAIRPDWVFHLAAYGAYPEQGDLHRMIATNLSATAHLLEAGRRSGCVAFVNAGSSSEYGFKEDAPTSAKPARGASLSGQGRLRVRRCPPGLTRRMAAASESRYGA